MRNVAVLSGKVRDEVVAPHPRAETVHVHDLPVICGIVRTRPPAFDRTSENDRSSVVVRVRAFSCNYRDRALVFAASASPRGNSFYVIGSDFVGEVIERGADVVDLEIGDRVIGNNAYVGNTFEDARVPQGILSNHASAEFQIVPGERLIKIPPGMPDPVAASFSINAQTAYSMIRKLGVSSGDNVLVMAARSNTSLFVINALRSRMVNTYAMTSSVGYEDQLRALGVKEVLHIDRKRRSSLLGYPPVAETVRSIRGFSYVIDPFYDINLPSAVTVLAAGGKYISCGLLHQYAHPSAEPDETTAPALQDALSFSISNNLQILFNCLGTTGDLRQAIEDYSTGKFDVVVDSVHSGDEVGRFVSRSFDAPDRFGKVVFQYS
jgi:NADPH:quinone reductase-like Zn-dependent oxidoreductase